MNSKPRRELTERTKSAAPCQVVFVCFVISFVLCLAQCDTRTVSLDGEGVVRLPLRSVPTLPCFWVVQSLSSSTSQTTAQNVVRVIYVRNLTSSELLRFLVSQINVLEEDPTFAYPMWSVHREQRAWPRVCSGSKRRMSSSEEYPLEVMEGRQHLEALQKRTGRVPPVVVGRNCTET